MTTRSRNNKKKKEKEKREAIYIHWMLYVAAPLTGVHTVHTVHTVVLEKLKEHKIKCVISPFAPYISLNNRNWLPR